MGNKQAATKHILYLVDKKKKDGILSLVTNYQEDVYEKFFDELIKIPENEPINIIITTDGGSAHWCSKICYVLKNRSGTSKVFVKSSAHSAGAIIALTASELYITYDTSLSAIDAQVSPLSDIFQTSLQNLSKFANDPVKTFSDLNKDRTIYFRNLTEKYLNDQHDKDLIMQTMHDSTSTHEQLFFKEDLDAMGIKYQIWDGDAKNIPGTPIEL